MACKGIHHAVDDPFHKGLAQVVLPSGRSKVTSKITLNRLGSSSRAQMAAWMALLQSTTTGLEIYVAAPVTGRLVARCLAGGRRTDPWEGMLISTRRRRLKDAAYRVRGPSD